VGDACDPTPNGPSRGGPGDQGGPGVNAEELKNGILSAQLRGRHLFVRVKCPAKAERRCRIRLAGRVKGATSRKATVTRSATVPPGVKKAVKLRVKPRHRGKVESRKRLMFTGQIKSGQTKAKFAKRLKLQRR
jgi:hypothetical protein